MKILLTLLVLNLLTGCRGPEKAKRIVDDGSAELHRFAAAAGAITLDSLNEGEAHTFGLWSTGLERVLTNKVVALRLYVEDVFRDGQDRYIHGFEISTNALGGGWWYTARIPPGNPIADFDGGGSVPIILVAMTVESVTRVPDAKDDQPQVKLTGVVVTNSLPDLRP